MIGYFRLSGQKIQKLKRLLSLWTMIPLIPYWKILLHSPLSRQPIRSELAATHEFVSVDQRTLQLSEDPLTPAEFQLERVIVYRNSFLPRIYGRVYPLEKGSRIQIVMTLSPIAWVVMLGFVGWFAPLTGLFSHEIFYSGHGVKPAAIIGFGYLLVMLGFGLEALAARRLLKDLFQVD